MFVTPTYNSDEPNPPQDIVSLVQSATANDSGEHDCQATHVFQHAPERMHRRPETEPLGHWSETGTKSIIVMDGSEARAKKTTSTRHVSYRYITFERIVCEKYDTHGLGLNPRTRLRYCLPTFVRFPEKRMPGHISMTDRTRLLPVSVLTADVAGLPDSNRLLLLAVVR